MTFAKLPAGAALFLDANVLVYHFANDPSFGPACTSLVREIEQQQRAGYTSTHIINEVTHRLMTIEAAGAYGWPFAGITRRLKRHPAEIQKLTQFRQAVDKVPLLGIQVIPITMPLLTAGAALSQQFGLLSGDALLVAVMQAHALANLASHDSDFDRVPGLTRYGPV